MILPLKIVTNKYWNFENLGYHIEKKKYRTPCGNSLLSINNYQGLYWKTQEKKQFLFNNEASHMQTLDISLQFRRILSKSTRYGTAKAFMSLWHGKTYTSLHVLGKPYGSPWIWSLCHTELLIQIGQSEKLDWGGFKFSKDSFFLDAALTVFDVFQVQN